VVNLKSKNILLSPEAVESFITRTMLSEQGRFAPSSFEFAATIYRARLRGSFAESLINGVEEETTFWAASGRNRQNEILRWLRQLTGHESAFWFYLLDNDKASTKKDIGKKAIDKKATGTNISFQFTRKARLDKGAEALEAPLKAFETDAPGPGGSSHLGLIGASTQWMLLYSYYLEEELEITIHGGAKLCQDLCRLLRVK
jgi:hypothetical protein